MNLLTELLPLWIALGGSLLTGATTAGLILGILRTKINLCYYELELMRSDITKAHERIDRHITEVARNYGNRTTRKKK